MVIKYLTRTKAHLQLQMGFFVDLLGVELLFFY